MGNNITSTIIRLLRSLLAFFLPGGLVLLFTFLAIHFNLVAPWIDIIEKVGSYVILAIGVILGWIFHRSRLVFVIFILFLSERTFEYGLEALIWKKLQMDSQKFSISVTDHCHRLG